MISSRELITRVYATFNQRDIPATLAFMDPNVDWPNGMEGGRVVGHQAVHDYWTRQWKTFDPRVDPVSITSNAAGETVVDVHQVVRNLSGEVLVDQTVQHVYTIRDGLIERMEIRSSPAS